MIKCVDGDNTMTSFYLIDYNWNNKWFSDIVAEEVLIDSFDAQLQF